jgi:hypothetical protein
MNFIIYFINTLCFKKFLISHVKNSFIVRVVVMNLHDWQNVLENRLLRLKLRTLIRMYAKFIPISVVEPFVLFPFTRDYLNLEMFKIFYLLGVYVKNVYFCMIFTFVFFFERSIFHELCLTDFLGSSQAKDVMVTSQN